MKYKEAMKIISALESKPKPRKSGGFMVSFERIEGSILSSDYFPDKHAGEKLIPTEDAAWNLAKRFAASTGRHIVNIYVIDQNFRPVAGYAEKKLKAYR